MVTSNNPRLGGASHESTAASGASASDDAASVTSSISEETETPERPIREGLASLSSRSTTTGGSFANYLLPERLRSTRDRMDERIGLMTKAKKMELRDPTAAPSAGSGGSASSSAMREVQAETRIRSNAESGAGGGSSRATSSTSDTRRGPGSGSSTTATNRGPNSGLSRSADGSSLRDRWSSKVSNFAIQYNLGCATLAIAIMQTHSDVIADAENPPDFPILTHTEKTLTLAMIFLGNVVGMLVMGYLGDAIGISRALVVTTTVSVVGQLGVAFLTHGEYIYEVFIACRFVLGIGIGGLYPLSAAQAAQEATKNGGQELTPQEEEARDREKSAAVGWNFFWQQPGNCAPYLVGLMLFAISTDTAFQFRFLVAVGLLPLLLVLTWNLEKVREEELAKGLLLMEAGALNASSPQSSSKEGAVVGSPSHVDLEAAGQTSYQVSRPGVRAETSKGTSSSSTLEDQLFSDYNIRTLIGTGGTWFLFDVAYYGTQIFSPFILQQIFTEKSLVTNCAQALVSACFQIPGTICGIQYLGIVDVKKLNTHGFIFMGAAFALLAVLKALAFHPYILYAAYCLLQFSLGFGCILSTYVLPTVVFAENVRGTMHGISAGLGKAGAAVGAFLFPAVSASLDPSIANQTLMATQALVCFAGLICNIIYVPWPPPGFRSPQQKILDSLELEESPQRVTGGMRNAPAE
ncbi:unnamed protein product [Amoebophrya sp. A25]|nr:unnamed protein product [Amoebophrya sp. A25]|eukprot:GSA25T00003233001.1